MASISVAHRPQRRLRKAAILRSVGVLLSIVCFFSRVNLRYLSVDPSFDVKRSGYTRPNPPRVKKRLTPSLTRSFRDGVAKWLQAQNFTSPAYYPPDVVEWTKELVVLSTDHTTKEQRTECKHTSVLIEVPRAKSKGPGSETIRISYNQTKDDQVVCVMATHESTRTLLFSVAISEKESTEWSGPQTFGSSQKLTTPHAIFNVDEDQIFDLYASLLPHTESPLDMVDILLSLPLPHVPKDTLRKAKLRILNDQALRLAAEEAEGRRTVSLLGSGADETDALCTVSTDPFREPDTEDLKIREILQGGPPKRLKFEGPSNTTVDHQEG